MSNKSSIEWLMIQLYEQGLLKGDGNKMDELLDQAKAMHKEEIMQSLNDGKAMALGSIENLSLEQYYNETFE